MKIMFRAMTIIEGQDHRSNVKITTIFPKVFYEFVWLISDLSLPLLTTRTYVTGGSYLHAMLTDYGLVITPLEPSDGSSSYRD